MYISWPDEIKDIRFDVTHLQGSRNLTDQLSRCGFANGDGPAALTGYANAESPQELSSWLGCDAPAPPAAMLAAVRARWAATWREAAATFAYVQGGDAIPSAPPRIAPMPLDPTDDHCLSLEFVQTLVAELAVDEVFGPIMAGAAAALCRLVDWLSTPIVEPASPQRIYITFL